MTQNKTMAKTKTPTKKKKPKYMVIDTETTLVSQQAFNIAYQITTHRGYQVEKKDFWLPEVLEEDTPWYPTPKPTTARSATRAQVHSQLKEDEKKIDVALAYNSPFDQKALKATVDFEFTKPVKDLWTAAAVYLCDEEYIEWARETGKVTPKGNIKTSAETVYQFISGVDDFEELHTAYQDTQCEKEILKQLIAKGVDLSKLENHPAPWRIVKKRAEKMDAANEPYDGMEDAVNGRRQKSKNS